MDDKGNSSSATGFTVPELLIVVAVIAVLVGLSFPVASGVKNKMHSLNCISNMKRIHGALDSFVKENRHWPQQPLDFKTSEDLAEWWYYALADYDVAETAWHCPIEEKLRRAVPAGEKSEKPVAYLSYQPTTFDGRALTPYRWNMPWLMEISDNHGEGIFLAMPDGSILTAPSILQMGNSEN